MIFDAFLPALQTCVCCCNVILLQLRGLLFILFCCQDEMARYDRVFVEHKQMSWILFRYLGNQESFVWIIEGIGLLDFVFGAFRRIILLRLLR